MPRKPIKILALFLCFSLIFEQSGFAQVAGQLDISGYISQLRNSVVQDKFRPLHLRYLSYDSTANNFKLLLDKGDNKKLDKRFVEDSSSKLLKYVFVGIALPADAFWVNLRPDTADQIIDERLGKTDVGKILLEADLQLKKDTAQFTSPQTPEGREYWDKLYKKAEELFGSSNLTIPTLTRPWIVPGEIIVRETRTSAYVYKATLKVMLEQDYLKGSAVYNFSDPRSKELNDYSAQLIRELILPKITQEVNTSKRYSNLRQVYYSLILAEWFKNRFSGRAGSYTDLIDTGDLTGLASSDRWSKNTYFEAYQKSFKDGEYNIKQSAYSIYGQTIRSYFSGGIVFGIAPGEAGNGLIASRIEEGLISGNTNRPILSQVNPEKIIGIDVDAGGDHLTFQVGDIPQESIEHVVVPTGQDVQTVQSEIKSHPAIQAGRESKEEQLAAIQIAPENLSQPKTATQEKRNWFISLTTSFSFHAFLVFALTLPWNLIFPQKPAAEPNAPPALQAQADLKSTPPIEITAVIPQERPAAESDEMIRPDGAVQESGKSAQEKISPEKAKQTNTEPIIHPIMKKAQLPAPIHLPMSPIRSVQENSAPAFDREHLRSEDDLSANRLKDAEDYHLAQVGNIDIYHLQFAYEQTHGEATDRAAIYSEDAENIGKVLNDYELNDKLTPVGDIDDSGFGARRNYRTGCNFDTPTLAKFFSDAQARGVALNKAENKIKDELIKKSLIARQGNKYVALRQAAVITSVPGSRQVDYHELGHALHVTDPQYRRAIEEIWQRLKKEDPRAYEAIRELLKYLNYSEEAFATEFAEYFDAGNQDPLWQAFNRIWNDACVWPGNVSRDKRAEAGKIFNKIIEHRHTQDERHPSGNYLTKEFAQSVERAAQKIAAAKEQALKRAGLKGESSSARPAVSYKETVRPFDPTKPVSVDQGIGIGYAMYHTRIPTFQGDYAELKKEINESKELNDVAKQKALKAIEEKLGTDNHDIFLVTVKGNDAPTVELVRRQDVPALSVEAGKVFSALNSQDAREYFNTLNQLLSQGKDWGRIAGLRLERRVNLDGEEYDLTLLVSLQPEIMPDGKESQKWEVDIYLSKDRESRNYERDLDAHRVWSSPAGALQQVLAEIKKTVAEKGLDLTPARPLTLDGASQKLRQKVTETKAKEAKGDSDHRQVLRLQREFVAANGRTYSVHLYQEAYRGGTETRLAIEQNGQVANLLGVRVEGQTDRAVSFEQAAKALKDKLSRRSFGQTQAPAVKAMPKQFGTTLHGLFVRHQDGAKIYLDYGQIYEHLEEFRAVLGKPGASLEEVRRFLDGHETFHALIDRLQGEDRGLAEIDETEEEDLADIFGRAFALGATQIDSGLRDELTVLSKRLGADLITVLEQGSQDIDALLDALGIDMDVEFKTPQEMAQIMQAAKAQGEKARAMEGAAGEGAQPEAGQQSNNLIPEGFIETGQTIDVAGIERWTPERVLIDIAQNHVDETRRKKAELWAAGQKIEAQTLAPAISFILQDDTTISLEECISRGFDHFDIKAIALSDRGDGYNVRMLQYRLSHGKTSDQIPPAEFQAFGEMGINLPGGQFGEGQKMLAAAVLKKQLEQRAAGESAENIVGLAYRSQNWEARLFANPVEIPNKRLIKTHSVAFQPVDMGRFIAGSETIIENPTQELLEAALNIQDLVLDFSGAGTVFRTNEGSVLACPQGKTPGIYVRGYRITTLRNFCDTHGRPEILDFLFSYNLDNIDVNRDRDQLQYEVMRVIGDIILGGANKEVIKQIFAAAKRQPGNYKIFSSGSYTHSQDVILECSAISYAHHYNFNLDLWKEAFEEYFGREAILATSPQPDENDSTRIAREAGKKLILLNHSLFSILEEAGVPTDASELRGRQSVDTYNLGLSIDYGNERWGATRIVLDFLQNHADAAREYRDTSGNQSRASVEFQLRNQTSWLPWLDLAQHQNSEIIAVRFRDNAQYGYTSEYLRQFGSRKGLSESVQVGQFGEGLKLATSACLRLGLEVALRSQNWSAEANTHKVRVGNEEYNNLGYKIYQEDPISGSETIVRCTSLEGTATRDNFGQVLEVVRDLKRLMLRHREAGLDSQDPLSILSTAAGDIVSLDQGDVYVKDFFITSEERERLIFGYNFGNLQTNRDRDIVSNKELKEAVGEILSRVTSQEIIEQVIKRAEAEPHGHYHEFQSLGKFSSFGEHAGLWADAFRRLYGPDAVLSSLDPHAGVEAEFIGYRVVQLNNNIAGALRKAGILFDYEMLQPEFHYMEEAELTQREREVLATAYKMDSQGLIFAENRPIEYRVFQDAVNTVDGRSLSNFLGYADPQGKFIAIKREVLSDPQAFLETYLEEKAHQLSGAPDGTRPHFNKLLEALIWVMRNLQNNGQQVSQILGEVFPGFSVQAQLGLWQRLMDRLGLAREEAGPSGQISASQSGLSAIGKEVDLQGLTRITEPDNMAFGNYRVLDNGDIQVRDERLGLDNVELYEANNDWFSNHNLDQNAVVLSRKEADGSIRHMVVIRSGLETSERNAAFRHELDALMGIEGIGIDTQGFTEHPLVHEMAVRDTQETSSTITKLTFEEQAVLLEQLKPGEAVVVATEEPQDNARVMEGAGRPSKLQKLFSSLRQWVREVPSQAGRMHRDILQWIKETPVRRTDKIIEKMSSMENHYVEMARRAAATDDSDRAFNQKRLEFALRDINSRVDSFMAILEKGSPTYITLRLYKEKINASHRRLMVYLNEPPSIEYSKSYGLRKFLVPFEESFTKHIYSQVFYGNSPEEIARQKEMVRKIYFSNPPSGSVRLMEIIAGRVVDQIHTLNQIQGMRSLEGVTPEDGDMYYFTGVDIMGEEIGGRLGLGSFRAQPLFNSILAGSLVPDLSKVYSRQKTKQALTVFGIPTTIGIILLSFIPWQSVERASPKLEQEQASAQQTLTGEKEKPLSHQEVKERAEREKAKDDQAMQGIEQFMQEAKNNAIGGQITLPKASEEQRRRLEKLQALQQELKKLESQGGKLVLPAAPPQLDKQEKQLQERAGKINKVIPPVQAAEKVPPTPEKMHEVSQVEPPEKMPPSPPPGESRQTPTPGEKGSRISYPKGISAISRCRITHGGGTRQYGPPLAKVKAGEGYRGYLAEGTYSRLLDAQGTYGLSEEKPEYQQMYYALRWPEEKITTVTMYPGGAREIVLIVPPGNKVLKVLTARQVGGALYHDRGNGVWYFTADGDPGEVIQVVTVPDHRDQKKDFAPLKIEEGIRQQWRASLPENIRKLLDTAKERQLSVPERKAVIKEIMKLFYYTTNPFLDELNQKEPNFIAFAFKYYALKCDGLAMLYAFLANELDIPVAIQAGYMPQHGDSVYGPDRHTWVWGSDGVEETTALVGKKSPLYEGDATDEDWEAERKMIIAQAAHAQACTKVLAERSRMEKEKDKMNAEIRQAKSDLEKAGHKAIDLRKAYFQVRMEYGQRLARLNISGMSSQGLVGLVNGCNNWAGKFGETIKGDYPQLQLMAQGHFLLQILEQAEKEAWRRKAFLSNQESLELFRAIAAAKTSIPWQVGLFAEKKLSASPLWDRREPLPPGAYPAVACRPYNVTKILDGFLIVEKKGNEVFKAIDREGKAMEIYSYARKQAKIISEDGKIIFDQILDPSPTRRFLVDVFTGREIEIPKNAEVADYAQGLLVLRQKQNTKEPQGRNQAQTRPEFVYRVYSCGEGDKLSLEGEFSQLPTLFTALNGKWMACGRNMSGKSQISSNWSLPGDLWQITQGLDLDTESVRWLPDGRWIGLLHDERMVVANYRGEKKIPLAYTGTLINATFISRNGKKESLSGKRFIAVRMPAVDSFGNWRGWVKEEVGEHFRVIGDLGASVPAETHIVDAQGFSDGTYLELVQNSDGSQYFQGSLLVQLGLENEQFRNIASIERVHAQGLVEVKYEDGKCGYIGKLAKTGVTEKERFDFIDQTLINKQNDWLGIVGNHNVPRQGQVVGVDNNLVGSVVDKEYAGQRFPQVSNAYLAPENGLWACSSMSHKRPVIGPLLAVYGEDTLVEMLHGHISPQLVEQGLRADVVYGGLRFRGGPADNGTLRTMVFAGYNKLVLSPNGDWLLMRRDEKTGERFLAGSLTEQLPPEALTIPKENDVYIQETPFGVLVAIEDWKSGARRHYLLGPRGGDYLSNLAGRYKLALGGNPAAERAEAEKDFSAHPDVRLQLCDVMDRVIGTEEREKGRRWPVTFGERAGVGTRDILGQALDDVLNPEVRTQEAPGVRRFNPQEAVEIMRRDLAADGAPAWMNLKEADRPKLLRFLKAIGAEDLIFKALEQFVRHAGDNQNQRAIQEMARNAFSKEEWQAILTDQVRVLKGECRIAPSSNPYLIAFDFRRQDRSPINELNKLVRTHVADKSIRRYAGKIEVLVSLLNKLGLDSIDTDQSLTQANSQEIIDLLRANSGLPHRHFDIEFPDSVRDGFWYHWAEVLRQNWHKFKLHYDTAPWNRSWQQEKANLDKWESLNRDMYSTDIRGHINPKEAPVSCFREFAREFFHDGLMILSLIFFSSFVFGFVADRLREREKIIGLSAEEVLDQIWKRYNGNFGLNSAVDPNEAFVLLTEVRQVSQGEVNLREGLRDDLINLRNRLSFNQRLVFDIMRSIAFCPPQRRSLFNRWLVAVDPPAFRQRQRFNQELLDLALGLPRPASQEETRKGYAKLDSILGKYARKFTQEAEGRQELSWEQLEQRFTTIDPAQLFEQVMKRRFLDMPNGQTRPQRGHGYELHDVGPSNGTGKINWAATYRQSDPLNNLMQNNMNKDVTDVANVLVDLRTLFDTSYADIWLEDYLKSFVDIFYKDNFKLHRIIFILPNGKLHEVPLDEIRTLVRGKDPSSKTEGVKRILQKGIVKANQMQEQEGVFLGHIYHPRFYHSGENQIYEVVTAGIFNQDEEALRNIQHRLPALRIRNQYVFEVGLRGEVQKEISRFLNASNTVPLHWEGNILVSEKLERGRALSFGVGGFAGSTGGGTAEGGTTFSDQAFSGGAISKDTAIRAWDKAMEKGEDLLKAYPHRLDNISNWFTEGFGEMPNIRLLEQSEIDAMGARGHPVVRFENNIVIAKEYYETNLKTPVTKEEAEQATKLSSEERLAQGLRLMDPMINILAHERTAAVAEEKIKTAGPAGSLAMDAEGKADLTDWQQRKEAHEKLVVDRSMEGAQDEVVAVTANRDTAQSWQGGMQSAFNAKRLVEAEINGFSQELKDPDSDAGKELASVTAGRKSIFATEPPLSISKYANFLGGLGSKVLDTLSNLSGLKQRIDFRVATVYYPLGGFDPYTPFSLFADSTDVVSMGLDSFGSPQDITKFIQLANSYEKVGFQEFDTVRALSMEKYDYDINGLGAKAISRIMALLGGNIERVLYFKIQHDGTIAYLNEEEIKAEGNCKNAVIEFAIREPQTGKIIRKRFWYLQHDLYDGAVHKGMFNGLEVKWPSLREALFATGYIDNTGLILPKILEEKAQFSLGPSISTQDQEKAHQLLYDSYINNQSYLHFVGRLSFQASLIKAAGHMWDFDKNIYQYNEAIDMETQRNNIIAKTIAPTIRNNAFLISDNRDKESGVRLEGFAPHSFWKQQPLSIAVEGSFEFGYSKKGDYVYFGPAEWLKSTGEDSVVQDASGLAEGGTVGIVKEESGVAVDRILAEIERRQAELGQLRGDAALEYAQENSLSDYLLRLELLHHLGILRGNVLYPSMGNDYLPAYFGELFGLNLRSGLGVDEDQDIDFVKEEMRKRGLPTEYESRPLQLEVLTYDNFDLLQDGSALQIRLRNARGVDTLLIKGLTHWVDSYKSYPGVKFGDTHEARMRSDIRDLVRKVAVDLLNDGGFVVIANEEDLWLAPYLEQDLGLVNVLAQPQNQRINQILTNTSGEDMHRLGSIDAVFGPVPIRVFQKPAGYSAPEKLPEIALPVKGPSVPVVGEKSVQNPSSIPVSVPDKKTGADPSFTLRIDSPEVNPGGIDFRALPIVTQPMTAPVFKPVNLTVKQANLNNPDKDWQEIRAMVEGGIIPSCQRIKEYLEASCKSKDCNQRIEKILACVADILRMQEDRVCATEPVLKQLLVVLESDQSAEQILVALNDIEVSPREPEIVVQ